MGGKRKYILSEPDCQYTTIGVAPTQFIKLIGSNFYYNKFHCRFMTFNMADAFTLKEAREIQSNLSEPTELTTMSKMK
jgi:hypothetical protein